jgi:hypothetical protein
MSYVHRGDGEKKFHKSIKKEQKYLRECGFVEAGSVRRRCD